MAMARRIFRIIGAEDVPIYAVKRILQQEGVTYPNDDPRHWSNKSIREIVLNDVYRAYAFE